MNRAVIISYASSTATGTAHNFALPASPPVSVSSSSGRPQLYYSGFPADEFDWNGSAHDSRGDLYSVTITQLPASPNVWPRSSSDFTITARSDYPWGSDVAFYTRSDGATVLKILNGWQGKLTVNFAGLTSGGYHGKAGYIVSVSPDSYYGLSGGVDPSLKFWARASGGGATDITPPGYMGITSLYGIGDPAAPQHPNEFKQGDGHYQAYGSVSAIPDPYPIFGIDLTSFSATAQTNLAVFVDEEYPGDYLSSGYPRQYTTRANPYALLIEWHPATVTTPPANVILSADVHEHLHLVAMCWIDSAGGLRQAINPTPDSSGSWQAPVTLESAHITNVGAAFLENNRLALGYDLSGALKIQTSDRLGFGAAGDWQPVTSPSGTPGWLSVGRAQNQSYAFGLTPDYMIIFVQSQDDTGKRWSRVTVAGGNGCGGAWLQDGYGCLYSNTGNAIYWITTDTPGGWGGTPVNTTLTGQVAGMTRLQNGTLVGLAWDATSKKCRALRSYDRGATWAKDTADIAAILALNSPPVVVGNQGKVYVCWQVGNAPASVVSVDCGLTWA